MLKLCKFKYICFFVKSSIIVFFNWNFIDLYASIKLQVVCDNIHTFFKTLFDWILKPGRRRESMGLKTSQMSI